MYLCPINRDFIEVKGVTPDRSCIFEVIQNCDGTYAFQGYNGKYLSRIHWPGYSSYILLIKNHIDQYSKFIVASTGTTNQISLKADNGKFWGRVAQGNFQGVEPVKNEVNRYSTFTVTVP